MKVDSNSSRFLNISPECLMEYQINNTASLTDDSNGTDDDPKKVKIFKPYIIEYPNGEKLYFEDIHTEDDEAYCSENAEKRAFVDGYGTCNKISSISVPYDTNLMYHIVKLGSEDETYINAYMTALEKIFPDKATILKDMSEDTEGGSKELNPNVIAFDTIRLYFMSGYFLEDIYGIRLSVYLIDKDGGKVYLTNHLITKEHDFDYHYLNNSLFFGNKIYDKYIQLRIPSVNNLMGNFNFDDGTSNTYRSIVEELNISKNSPIYIEYVEVNRDDITDFSDDITFDLAKQIKFRDDEVKNDAIIYSDANKRSSAVPLTANSDRITAYITAKDGYVEFCGKWDDEVISDNVVAQFNTVYKLYNVNASRNVDLYNADADNKTEWIAYHEIHTQVYGRKIEYDEFGNRILNTNTLVDEAVTKMLYDQCYTYTQVFNANPMSDNSDMLFFKPVIKDTEAYGYEIDGISFMYNYRLINVKDDVQFMRNASVSYDGNVADFFLNTVRLDFGDSLKTYNVYNKIENVTNKIVNEGSNGGVMRYSKVFYNTSDIVMDNNGQYTGDNDYVLTLSDSPKNYKFKFRKYDNDNVLTIMDLSEGVYKLYSRDADGNDIVIEPTYSSNMNTVLGELEFNISVSNILKLKNVDASKRFMSVVVVNTDNSIYSMFDFTYE